MSNWNHRVVKETLSDGTDWYSIREVFYNDDGTIYAYTEQPVDISGESIEDMRKYCQWVLACLDRPVLVDGKVEFVDYDDDELADDEDEDACAGQPMLKAWQP